MLIPSSNVNTTPELRTFILTGFLRFFRRFPQINVGGDSAHLSSLEDVPVSPASPSRRRIGCDTFKPIKQNQKHSINHQSDNQLTFSDIIPIICSFSSNDGKLDQNNHPIIPIHSIHTFAQLIIFKHSFHTKQTTAYNVQSIHCSIKLFVQADKQLCY